MNSKLKVLKGYEDPYRPWTPAQKMWRQFITYMVEPRKKNTFIGKKTKESKSWPGGHGEREKARRRAQIAKGMHVVYRPQQ